MQRDRQNDRERIELKSERDKIIDRQREVREDIDTTQRYPAKCVIVKGG